MSTLKEFKAFAVKGNVIDLAVGVIIGAAFAKIVDSLVGDVVMPVISTIIGGLDFSSYYIPLNHQSWGLPLAEAKKAGAVLAYGNFLTIMINFVLLAFIIFQMVRLIQRARARQEAPAAPPVEAPPAEEVVLLRQIRDAITGEKAKSL